MACAERETPQPKPAGKNVDTPPVAGWALASMGGYMNENAGDTPGRFFLSRGNGDLPLGKKRERLRLVDLSHTLSHT